MQNNIQCRATQIKPKKPAVLGAIKKAKSKDSLCAEERRGRKVQAGEIPNYANPHPELIVLTKSGDQSHIPRNIQEEYYMHEKHPNKPKRISQMDKGIRNDGRSITGQSQQKSNEKQEAATLKKKDSSSKIHKLKFNDSKVVINFDGKMVKVRPNCNIKNRNYTSIEITEYSAQGKEHTHILQPKPKPKSKSKHTSRFKKTNSCTSMGLGTDQRLHTSQESISTEKAAWGGLEYELKFTATQLSEETQVSPLPQRHEYDRPQLFDLDQIHALIEEDLQTSVDMRFSQSLVPLRRQSLQLMSQLCAEMQLRRETLYLAISIFDRAIAKKIRFDNYCLVGLASLALALKLEQAQLAMEFMCVLGTMEREIQPYLYNSQNNKPVYQKSTEREQSCKSKKSLKKCRLKLKAEDVRRISISGVTKILKNYNCNPIAKTTFMELEEKIAGHLKFKLWRMHAIYWADLLTCMWDQTILAKQSTRNSVQLLFRCPTSLTNLAYLYQILEMAYISDAVYRFPSIYVVLSSMYLLIRIAKENMHNGFQFYHHALPSSTNILFVDASGVNQIFWSFIEKLKVQMADILSSCQFISTFLVPTIMKDSIPYDEKKDSVDSQLYIHQFNPDIYKHFGQ